VWTKYLYELPALSDLSQGKTIPLDGKSDEDLDIETLSKDLEELLVTLFPDPVQSPTFIVRMNYLANFHSVIN
jgi:hypothetical protein